MRGLGAKELCTQDPAQPLTSYVTLRKLPSLIQSQYSQKEVEIMVVLSLQGCCAD